MNFAHHLFASSAIVLGLCAMPAAAQSDMRSPAVTYLMQQHGISETEAQERMDVQLLVTDLAQDLNTTNDPAFGGIYIQHEPVFKVVVSFADKDDRKAFQSALSPKLQRFVQIRNAKRNKRDIESGIAALNDAFAATNAAFVGGYDLKKERYTYTVGSQDIAQQFRSLVPPQLRSDVDIDIGATPGLEAAPTGAQAGDSIRGGQTAYRTTGSASCTFSYAVNYTSGTTAKRGILTAGHCPDTLVHKIGSRNVTLSGPVVQRQTCGVGGKYDYKILETTGLNTSYTIEYKDLNSIPEFPATGTLNLTSIKSFNNQTAGMVMCKSGQTTGITCGKITDGNASFRDNGTGCTTGTASTGFIKVSQSQQADLSAGGDSGGPWFMYPGSSSDIVGVGIHTAGGCKPGVSPCQSDTGPTAYSLYMPIDYIDDHISSVSTVKK